ncbi:MAG: hypothetical protein ACI4XS_09445 [Bacillus sp. (in: firmicutes)]
MKIASDYKISIPDKEEDDKIATFYSLIYKADYQKNHSHKQMIDLLDAQTKRLT